MKMVILDSSMIGFSHVSNVTSANFLNKIYWLLTFIFFVAFGWMTF